MLCNQDDDKIRDGSTGLPPIWQLLAASELMTVTLRTYGRADGARWLVKPLHSSMCIVSQTHRKTSPNGYYTRTSMIVLVLISAFLPVFVLCPVDNVDKHFRPPYTHGDIFVCTNHDLRLLKIATVCSLFLGSDFPFVIEKGPASAGPFSMVGDITAWNRPISPFKEASLLAFLNGGRYRIRMLYIRSGVNSFTLTSKENYNCHWQL